MDDRRWQRPEDEAGRPWWRPDREAARASRALLALLPTASRRLTTAAGALVMLGAALPVAFTLATGAVVGSVPGAVEGGLASPAGRRLLGALAAAVAGKTTLVKLLCRFYEPTAGRITVDGVDLRDLEPAAWRERLAGAFQDFCRMELLAAESVGAGDLPRIADRAAVTAALERAHAADV